MKVHLDVNGMKVQWTEQH